MKISKLINTLNKYKTEYGDIEVYMETRTEGYYITKIPNTRYSKLFNNIRII